MSALAGAAGTAFYKMSGSGNDFIFLDGRSTRVQDWSPERIREICATHTGVGADGLAIIEPGSAPEAIRFHFFNNDGGRTDMCGNAALCATRLATQLKMAPGDGLTLETDAGAYQARVLPGPGERAEVRFGPVTGFTASTIKLEKGETKALFGVVGVPHLVVVVDDTTQVAVADRGRALRSHPSLGPAGANVNFVSPRQSEWAMRTFERGVEAETLACGTGTVAVAVALSVAGLTQLPCHIRSASGCELVVRGTGAKDGAGDVWLSGEGRMVFRGVLGL